MRGQMEHLIEMSQRQNLIIQVIPFQADGHAGAGGPFSLLHFADRGLPDVIYLEQLTCAQHHDKPAIVDDYSAVMDRFGGEATTPAGSVKILRSMLRYT